MSALTSLLVRDLVVPVKKIEEAIQRQVISGGDLGTVLLELGVIEENVLAAYLAAMHGLLPATRDEVLGAPSDVAKLVTAEVVEDLGVVPIAAEGRTLVVAASEPPGGEALRQLGFLVGLDLSVRIAPAVRVAAAMAKHHDIAMTPRFRRLERKLLDRPAGAVPYVAPLEVNTAERSADVDLTSRSSSGAVQSADEGSGTERFGAVEDAPMNRPAPSFSSRVRSGGGGSNFADSPAELADGAPTRTLSGGSPSIPVLRGPDTRSAGRPTSALVERHRGPLTAKRAVEMISEAETRDDVVAVSFAFIRQFFDYTALFVMHDDEAEGLDADGPGAPWKKVQRLAVSAAGEGSLGLVREQLTPRIAVLEEAAPDRALARGLEREGYGPAILLPVAIRQRLVLVIYGDRAGEDFGQADLPEVLAFLPRISEALQRLILRRKLRARDEPSPDVAAAPQAGTGFSKPEGAGFGTSKDGNVREDPASSSSAAGSLKAPGVPTDLEVPPSGGPEAIDLTPSTGGGRRPSSIPATAPERPRQFEVLGVPRKAPPPPKVAPVVTVLGAVGPPTRESSPPEDSTTKAEPHGPTDVQAAMRAAKSSSGRTLAMQVPREEVVELRRRKSPPAEAAEASDAYDDDDEPELEFGDDEPELEIGTDDGASEESASEPTQAEEAPATPDARPRRQVGVYSVRSVAAEVVGNQRSRRRPASRSERPSPGDPRVEPTKPRPESDAVDPRREAAGEVPVDAVRVPSAVAVPSEMPPPMSSTGADTSSAPPAVPSKSSPNVIIDLGGDQEDIVRELARLRPEESDTHIERVVSLGDAALPALVQAFPGELWLRRMRGSQRRPRGQDISAIARAMVQFGDRAVPYVASLLGHREPDIRYYATLLASELVHRDLVAPLGVLLFDEDAGLAETALAVIRSFRRYGEEYAAVIERVRANARRPRTPLETRSHALRSLGALRDERAVQLLVDFLDSNEEMLADAAYDALVVLTRQDFGMAPKKWRAWLERYGDANRIEWLIDALLHPEEKQRRLASDELKSLTQAYFGYSPTSPKREREVSYRKYRAWWEDQGQARHSLA